MSLKSDSNTWNTSDPLIKADIVVGQTLLGGSSDYSVLEFIGEGSFGKVVKCLNLKAKKTVAVKILKGSDSAKDTEKEVSMMKKISVLNIDHCNLVKFYERFQFMGKTCLAFEMLDRTLDDLLREANWMPLNTNVIRPIAQQLLVALDALQDLGVLHADIKPDNIMLVDMEKQPFWVKLIDFGLAIPASQIHPGLTLQPIGCRAPEVSLGLPFTTAVDVWGVGCVLAFLYLAENPFPGSCEYQMMSYVVKLLGQPDDDMLEGGLYSRRFFTKEAAEGTGWRLMTHEDFLAAKGKCATQQHSSFELPTSLDQLVDVHPIQTSAEYLDRMAFINFLKELLNPDGERRISPREALQHRFITMSHLSRDPSLRDYLTSSQTLMEVCSIGGSAGRSDTSATSKFDQEPSNKSNVADGNWDESDAASAVCSFGEIQLTDSMMEVEPCVTEKSSSGCSLGEKRDPVCCSDAASILLDENPASWFIFDFHTSIRCVDKPTGFCEEDFSQCPTGEATRPPVSASGSRRFFKEIRNFFSQVSKTFSSCCRPHVED